MDVSKLGIFIDLVILDPNVLIAVVVNIIWMPNSVTVSPEASHTGQIE